MTDAPGSRAGVAAEAVGGAGRDSVIPLRDLPELMAHLTGWQQIIQGFLAVMSARITSMKLRADSSASSAS